MKPVRTVLALVAIVVVGAAAFTAYAWFSVGDGT